MDDRQVAPGDRWIQELQEVLAAAPASAVFLGKDGLGATQALEIDACTVLHLDPHRHLPIIPVLLPGLPDGEVPLFLKTLSFVDFREGITAEGLGRLAGALQARSFEAPPAPPPRTRCVHNLPFLPLGDFLKGRSEDLEQLAAILPCSSGDVATARTLVLHGLGGIGKTRLAVEHAWRSGHRYEAALFVVADSPQALRSGLAGLARLGLPGLSPPASRAQDEEIAAVLAWLREHDRWLLILDNVDLEDAAEAVLEILPRLGAGHVLITSRRREWPAGIPKQPLAALPRKEAVDFLLQRTEGERASSPQDAGQAGFLADVAGGLPLALEQAAAYIAHHQISFATYLEHWERERDAVLAWHDRTLVQSPAALAVTWQTTFHQLSPTAAAILRLSAFLAPDPIPSGLFEKSPDLVEEAVKLLHKETGQGTGSRPVREAISELAACSMIAREAGSFSVHRMVQEVLRARIPEPHQRQWIERALRLVDGFSPPEPGDVRTWPVWDLLRPHAAVVAERADRAGITRPTARLMSQLAVLFYARSLYTEAEPLMRRALKLYEGSFGTDHPEVAVRLNNLASLLQATDRPAEAEPLLRRALKIDESCFGPKHPNVARDLNNLARLLAAANRLAETEPLLRRALEIWEESLGTGHPNVAAALNNLAAMLQAMNRLTEAEPLLRRALEIDEASLGTDHPGVARDLNNLASLLQAADRPAEAEPLLRRALGLWESSLGPDDPHVAAALNNLAALLQAANRPEEAGPLLRRAVEICETRLGPDHPRARAARANLEALAGIRKPSAAGAPPDPLPDGCAAPGSGS